MRKRVGTRRGIEDFLGQKRLAIVGVSRREKEYSRLVFRELVKRGFDVVPVNPEASEIDGAPCYPKVSAVPAAVEGVVVLLPNAAATDAVRDSVRAGVRRIWLRNDVPAARELCQNVGVELVSGYCPFMFLPDGAFVHKCHAFGLRLAGQTPA